MRLSITLWLPTGNSQEAFILLGILRTFRELLSVPSNQVQVYDEILHVLGGGFIAWRWDLVLYGEWLSTQWVNGLYNLFFFSFIVPLTTLWDLVLYGKWVSRHWVNGLYNSFSFSFIVDEFVRSSLISWMTEYTLSEWVIQFVFWSFIVPLATLWDLVLYWVRIENWVIQLVFSLFHS